MRILFCVMALFCCGLFVSAQRGNNWVFGNKAWINFTTSPISVGTSAMFQLEGSSSISDPQGNLLFYSDGMTVWNARHLVMPNGTGLAGDFSSTQSSMIVPFPADPKRYYLFTMDVINGVKGLSYSVANMDLDNGDGDIESKNHFLIGPSTEKVTSVNHCNGKDVWVVTATTTTDKFYAYLVTASGINAPVISTMGVTIPYFSIGYLKFSPDGTKLACANLGTGLDLFDFDPVSGMITNRRSIISGTNQHVYGVEFSPNSQLMYVSNTVRSPPSQARFDVSQYAQLDSPAPMIISTRTELDNYFMPSAPPYFAWFNALQLAPDGKIYISVFSQGGLKSINAPDRPGAACNYSNSGILLAATTNCLYGLPDFNQSYVKGTFTYDISCTNNDVLFYTTTPRNSTGIKWDFGDPASGINNTSTLDSPVHTFSAPGIYEVKLVSYLNCRNDTMKKMVRVEPLKVDLGPDKDICAAMLVLDPLSQGSSLSYLWQDNSTSPVYNASSSGLYWVEVNNNNNGCVARDSIQLVLYSAPVVYLGNDTTICERTTLVLDAGNPGAQYIWQDNSNGQTFLVRRAGVYHVKVKVGDCESSDTIVVQIKNIPRVYLGNDTAICNGMTINLAPILNHADNAGFLWNTGDITPNISVTQPGLYSIEVTNLCGIAVDGITVKQGVCQLYMPTAFSPNNDGKNDTFKPGYGENVVSYSMEIYNRWGEKVFASSQVQKGWDGKFKNVLQPAAVFAWFIRYKVFNDPKEYHLKGTVALVY